MDFMHQTVASTIVKYFTWLFDNDGYINGTHFFISLHLFAWSCSICKIFAGIITHDLTIAQGIAVFFISFSLYMITVFPVSYIIFIYIF